MKKLWLFIMCMLVWPVIAHAMCFDDAAITYDLPAELLKAVARVESGSRELPPSFNRDGSYDIGIMRINSGWLPQLRRYGIGREALNEPCQNVFVGAWILANNKQRLGANWMAVGAYNVGCKKVSVSECERLRVLYSWKIYCAMYSYGVDSRCRAYGAMRKPRQ